MSCAPMKSFNAVVSVQTKLKQWSRGGWVEYRGGGASLHTHPPRTLAANHSPGSQMLGRRGLWRQGPARRHPDAGTQSAVSDLLQLSVLCTIMIRINAHISCAYQCPLRMYIPPIIDDIGVEVQVCSTVLPLSQASPSPSSWQYHCIM